MENAFSSQFLNLGETARSYLNTLFGNFCNFPRNARLDLLYNAFSKDNPVSKMNILPVDLTGMMRKVIDTKCETEILLLFSINFAFLYFLFVYLLFVIDVIDTITGTRSLREFSSD